MDKKVRVIVKKVNRQLFRARINKISKNKFVKRMTCFFKGHDYGPIHKTNYRELNNFILTDKIQICRRCKHRLKLNKENRKMN